MYKVHFFVFLFLYSYCNALAQNCAGAIFSTQVQIDSFILKNPNCKIINSPVLIEGEDIDNLSAFQNIEKINSYLLIRGCSRLKNLEGLNNLQYVKDFFFVHENDSLENIDALHNLHIIEGVLDFTRNYSLKNIKPLVKLVKIKGLQVTNNHSLESLEGLEGLIEIEGNIAIQFNESLASLSKGFQILNHHLNDIIIVGNKLTNLEGLENLTHVEGDLQISGSLVSDLSVLQNLRHIGGSLQISKHERLVSFIHLAELQSIGGWLGLSDNPSITHLNGLENISIGGGLGLFNMKSLQNIHILENLTKIDGGFRMWNCPLVISLEGLHKITHLNDINLINNESLADLTALKNVTLVEGRLWISGNPSLISLQGLHNITSVGWFIEIRSNDNLQDLKGLSGLTHVGGNLKIMRNDHPEFTDLSGMEKLKNIGGYLQIDGNLSLTSLEGIGALDATFLDSLLIINSPVLSDCAVESVCAYLETPENISIISENTLGCNSVEEVNTACQIVSTPSIRFISEWQIFPNPSKGLFSILGKLSPTTVVELRNHLGQVILLKSNNTKTINLRNFPAGLYWIHLKEGSKTLEVRKLVKY